MVQSHSFLWLSNSLVYIHHSFFIRSCVVGHLDCFHIFVVVNNAAVKVGVYVFLLKLVFLFSLDTYSEVELLDCIIALFLTL